MPKKSKGPRVTRQLSRRQVSHWERQKRRQRIIFIAGMVIIVAVLAIVGAGWYVIDYRPFHETAITVNGVSYDMAYYIDMLKFRNQGQQPEYIRYIADAVEQAIIQSQLIRDEAARLGITATPDEVSKQLKTLNLPDEKIYRDVAITQVLAAKVRDDYLAKDLPKSAPQANIQAMLLESEQQATEVRARLEKGESFGDLAAQLSLDPTTKNAKGDLGWHTADIFASELESRVPGDYGLGSEAGTLSQPRLDAGVSKQIGYWLLQVVDKPTPTTARVFAMLVGSKQQAQDIVDRLVKREDFAALARQFSQLPDAKDNGGDLGEVSPGIRTAAFDGYVFGPNADLGVVSPPVPDTTVTTREGYWLIKVLDKSNDRPLSDDDLAFMKSTALNNWITSLMANPDNQIDASPLDDATKKEWAISQATRSSTRPQ